jgi:hypothetical protein
MLVCVYTGQVAAASMSRIQQSAQGEVKSKFDRFHRMFAPDHCIPMLVRIEGTIKQDLEVFYVCVCVCVCVCVRAYRGHH